MKTSDIKITGYPFVSHVDQTARPELPLNVLLEKVSNNCDIQKTGIYKSMGYKYDIRPYLKRFVYLKYGCWYESYAINRTALRAQTYGKIDHILDYK